MYANYLWNFLQFTSVLGTGYVGFLQAEHIKNAINHPVIRPYKEKIPLRQDHFLNENNFCRLTGSVLGGVVGYHCWPATLLLSLPFIEEAWRGRGGGGGADARTGNMASIRRIVGWF